MTDTPDIVRAALAVAAEIAALRAENERLRSGRIAVKRLEWRNKPRGTRPGFDADTPLGRINVAQNVHGAWVWTFGGEWVVDSPQDTAGAAIDAAERDYKARVLSCLLIAGEAPHA